MAKTALATIKSWFVKGAKPTQAQFSDWLDSFFHKDDIIPAANLATGEDLLIVEGNVNHANTTLYDFFPAGYILEYMIVTNTTGNASSTPNFGTNGIGYFSAPTNFEAVSKTSGVFHNPAATGTDGVYFYYNFVKQILFSSTCKDFIATATAWNDADYNIKFYLKKLI
jgi:hypothetical protein